MTERFFSATKELVSQEISNSVNQGKRYFGLVSRAPGVLVQQIGRLTDEPGYLYRGGRWVRVTRASGYSIEDFIRSGARPGQISKLRATLASVMR